jgi:iron complex outermembrane recepter protein
MRKFELLGATALAMLVSAPAYSQTTAPQAAGDATATEDAGEIIVTAAKRAQTLQDTAISVSVTDAKTIEQAQVRDLIDLQGLVPSLKVPQFQSTGQTNFVIRGFGNGNGNAGIESSVGVFVDGIYRSRSAAALSDLPELERIEVLRGPQSTLFGKNVSAGAISIITKKPQFDFGLKAEATLSNYGGIGGKISGTGGLSETIAVRLSGSFDTRQGYFNNIVTGGKSNDRNRYSLRADILFEPSDALSLRLIGDYSRINEICCGVVPVQNGAATAFIGAPLPTGLGAQIGDPTNLFSYRTVQNVNPSNLVTSKGLSLQADLDIGFGKLTSITAYRSEGNSTEIDPDFTGAKILNQTTFTNIDSFSQELRIASTGNGPLSWLVGGFFSDEKISTGGTLGWGPDARKYVDTGLAGGAIGLIEGLQRAGGNTGASYFRDGDVYKDDFLLKNQSYSFFGQIDFEVIKGLTLTAGGAYMNDYKKARSISSSTDQFAQLNLNNLSFGAPVVIGALPTAALRAGALGLAQSTNAAATLASPIPVNFFGVINGGALAGLQFLKPLVDFPNATEDGILKGNKFSYMLRAAYEVSRRFNVYATYSTGWKAGAYNLSRDSRPPTQGVGRSADPENVIVYEIGAKASFPGGFANLALFKQTINGFQSNAFTGTGFNLVNAGKQSVKGFEFDAGYRPLPGLNLGLGVTYLDPIYDSFTKAACVPFDARCTAGVQFRDLSGTKPTGISEWSVSLNANYEFAVAESLKAFVRAEYDYASSIVVSQQTPPSIGTFNFNNINASFGIKTDNKLELTFWVRNLTEDKAFIATFASVAQAGSYSGYPIQPRTMGVTFRKTF